jgi:hypothetical protein
VTGFSEPGNEPSGSIRNKLRDYQLFKVYPALWSKLFLLLLLLLLLLLFVICYFRGYRETKPVLHYSVFPY